VASSVASQKQQLTIEGHTISVSNLDKLMYPGGRFTKAKVIDYYVKVAAHLLPHLKDRPVTLKRFPEGVFGEFFYEKDAPSFTPNWVKTVPVPRKNKSEPDIRYIVIDNLATLVWLANLTNLEIHPFLHRAPRIHRPTAMVFDCDPGEGANVLHCARVALLLRGVLAELNLQAFVKVSGSKGLQVYVPFNREITYEVTQALAKALAELLEEREPKLVVSQMPKAFRAKKVFIDWSQNTEFKTTVGVYSLRAKIYKPFVSMPVQWEELEKALNKGKPDLLYFKPEAALAQLENRGDIFKPVLTLVQKPPPAIMDFLSSEHARSETPTSLQTYNQKRDFSKTAEPPPRTVRRSRQGSRRRFVIQKHAASHLHYDFRLEMHGVLKSWAVPKGPPVKEADKRLAMATEDHPLDYLNFEGIIPKGQYGGGTVMVWDIGTYDLMEGNYYKGFLRVFLQGAKLKGEWTLKKLPRDDREKWQLFKTAGNTRTISKKRDDLSVLTQRTMAEIRDAADAVWNSSR
jgi:bifunctional non-homologous end joining protein LigD